VDTGLTAHRPVILTPSEAEGEGPYLEAGNSVFSRSGWAECDSVEEHALRRASYLPKKIKAGFSPPEKRRVWTYCRTTANAFFLCIAAIVTGVPNITNE
jgi:hypothetical protein